MPAVPGATDAFMVGAVDAPSDLVSTFPDGHGGHAAAWEHVFEALAGERTRFIVRRRVSSHWLEPVRAQPPVGRHRIFIERASPRLAGHPR
jgi:hypothetical protein